MFEVHTRVRKIGGYTAVGTIVAVFATFEGHTRYVFEFDEPKGLLHIFSDANLETLEDK